MKNRTLIAMLACASLANINGVNAETNAVAPSPPGEVRANSTAFPKQILRTGINLNTTTISPNSAQLANDIHLAAILEQLQATRQRIGTLGTSGERAEARIDLLEQKQQATQIINRTNLEIDFAMAEMTAEQNVYTEILSTFTANRDKLVARVNAASFISNGLLWAVCEALAIPTHTRGVYANPSGVTGILAGVIPSFASMYTLKAVNGAKKTSEVEPNMLAKLFKYPTTGDIDYPNSVWLYLNEVPATESTGKTRLDSMIDRWVSDSNIPGFTSRGSSEQLDVITASVARKKGLTISSLNTRQVMLQQLSAEIMKMKRMLLELSMVVSGEKQFVALQTRTLSSPTSKSIDSANPGETAATPNRFSSLEAATNVAVQQESYAGVP